MERMLQNNVKSELCPDGIWQLTDISESVLKRQISRLPKGEVSDTDTRYPTTPASMRAFLEVFFTRHYFQVQNSLLDYITSDDFLDVLVTGQLQILDIGCGPAVASLAITNMVLCLLKNLKETGGWQLSREIKINYLLNDPDGFCLGTAQNMLSDYFQLNQKNMGGVVCSHVISIQKAFPDNMNQLRRIKLNLGTYDITVFSYVVVPLSEDNEQSSIAKGLLEVEALCSNNGRLLILQDKFQEALIRQIGREIENPSNKQTLTQEIFPKRNEKETHTYTYYQCLYAPRLTDAQRAMV